MVDTTSKKDLESLSKVAENVENLYFLVMNVASYIHLFYRSDKIIREIFKEAFMPALSEDISKAATLCGTGYLHPYAENIKKGWVPLISEYNNFSVCFSNGEIHIGSNYFISGESKIKCTDTTYLGELEFCTQFYNNDVENHLMKNSDFVFRFNTNVINFCS